MWPWPGLTGTQSFSLHTYKHTHSGWDQAFFMPTSPRLGAHGDNVMSWDQYVASLSASLVSFCLLERQDPFFLHSLPWSIWQTPTVPTYVSPATVTWLVSDMSVKPTYHKNLFLLQCNMSKPMCKPSFEWAMYLYSPVQSLNTDMACHCLSRPIFTTPYIIPNL